MHTLNSYLVLARHPTLTMRTHVIFLQREGHLSAIVGRLRAWSSPWFVKDVDIILVKKDQVEKLTKSIGDLNKAQAAGEHEHTVTTHVELKKYLVWGLEEADVDAGIADVKVCVIHHIIRPSCPKASPFMPS